MTQNPISLQVSLPQMLDLALGTPEVGSINLNILHNFLHVLLHQINLTNLKIEYRGDDANRIKTIITSLKTGPSIYLHEYSITDNAGNVTKRTHTPDTPVVAAEIYTTDSKTSLDLDKSNGNISTLKNDITTGDVLSDSSASVRKETKGMKQKIGVGVEDSCQSVIFVEPVKDGVVPSALGFKKINETVVKLERQFRALEELATNPEIIERIKTSRPDPLNDMWSMININKRLDASEQGISKLMTMLQDIIKCEEINPSTLPIEKQDSVSSGLIDNYVHSNDRLSKLETDLMNINDEIMQIKEMLEVRNEPDVPQEQKSFSEKNPLNIKEEIDNYSDDISELMNESDTYSFNSKKHSSFSSQADRAEIKNFKAEGKFSPQLSAASGLATAGSASGVDKAMIKSNLSDVSSKIPSSDSKRSNISSYVLHELKVDVSALKSDVEQSRQNIEELRYKVEQFIEQQPSADRAIKTESNVRISIKESKSVHSKSSSSKRSSSGIKEPVEPKYSSSFNAVEVSQSIASNTSLPGSKELGITDSHFTNQDNKHKSKSMGAIKSTKDTGDYDENIKDIEARISALEHKIKAVDDNRKVSESSNVDEIKNLVTRMQKIHNDVEEIKQVGDMIFKEKEKSDILIEQIELLKILKADKEDLEDALTDKADTETVNRKVSNDRFDSAYDDLTQNLEAAVSKLTQQENTWSHALINIQQEVDSKLDRVELTPVEEFINNQFQAIQEKLDDLEEERQKNEAAGTKKILNDVLCISCNKNVVMRMDQGPTYKNNFISHDRNNNKPFSIYNSDRMRKQLKQYPGKNINQFTALMRDTRRKRPQRNNIIEKSSKDHFCNRYCGGSHTITTPQQRVMRAGPFPAELSPEILNPEIPATSRPIVCKPEKNVCCSAFNDQLAALNQQQQQQQQQRLSSEIMTTIQPIPKQNDQKYKISKASLVHQDSKRSQSKQHQEESLNSKNTLPSIIDNEGNVQ